MPDFHGEPTRILENRFVELEYLAGAARIVRFSPKGRGNLFADLGSSFLRTPYGEFYFRGGHRLWHSPEAMPRTYIPDNAGAAVTEIANGIRIDMPAEPWTQIAKSLEIQLNPARPQVIVRHELRNDGAWTVEFAPWALTMLCLGGTAIFPQPQEKVDEAALLPNRRLSLWSYTRADDARFTVRDDFATVRAVPDVPPLKFGYFNPHGWMAYWLDETLFVKRFEVQPNRQYPDQGCNTECYCNDQFIELESLGPLAPVAAGQVIAHTELWEIHEDLEVPFLTNQMRALLRGPA